jgi:hypothetical protein
VRLEGYNWVDTAELGVVGGDARVEGQGGGVGPGFVQEGNGAVVAGGFDGEGEEGAVVEGKVNGMGLKSCEWAVESS